MRCWFIRGATSIVTIGIFWFRQDLRLSDNRALIEACKSCDELLPVFIDDPAEQTVSALGAASRVWLHHSLQALQISLQEKGSDLLLASGASLEVLEQLIECSGATRVFWNRCYDPVTIKRDTAIKKALREFAPKTFNSLLINEPWDNLKGDGTPYRVYTPYWRALARTLDANPEHLTVRSIPRSIPALAAATVKTLKKSGLQLRLEQLKLLPSRSWHVDMMAHWQPGEQAARRQLDRFLKTSVDDYDSGRNLPAESATSRLSPHLHFGEISPRYVLQRLLAGRRIGQLSDDQQTFAREIVWREFAYSLIYHFPKTIDQPLDARFARFKWARNTDVHLQAWQRGLTGVPIVDAGMRELYATGWMHNRVRMIVASYLIKNLLIPWQSGERWFRDTLVDADLASNAMGWQWTAGSGADAAPFFRVFNPVLQGEKFDTKGLYVKKWVPELNVVPIKYIHKPWELDAESRAHLDYPEPLVDLKKSRQSALDAFSAIKGN